MSVLLILVSQAQSQGHVLTLVMYKPGHLNFGLFCYCCDTDSAWSMLMEDPGIGEPSGAVDELMQHTDLFVGVVHRNLDTYDQCLIIFS